MDRKQFDETSTLMATLVEFKNTYGEKALINLIINTLIKIFTIQRIDTDLISKIVELLEVK